MSFILSEKAQQIISEYLDKPYQKPDAINPVFDLREEGQMFPPLNPPVQTDPVVDPCPPGYQLIDATLESRAKGGPVRAGKPYMVGEKGPEVVIPRQSGKVVSNDDARIFAMLLAANPQLQKVSKARAEKIIRARFPEYFEV